MADFSVVNSSNCQEDFDRLTLEHGDVFFKKEVLACSGDKVEQWAICDPQGKCIGGFNIQIIKLKGIPAITAPKFHPHCGLFCLPFSGTIANVQGKMKKVLTAVAKFLDERPEKIVAVPFPPNIEDMQPFIWSEFKTNVKYTYHLRIDEDEEPMEMFSSKTRNAINKGVKSGLTFELNPAPEGIIELLNANAKEQGFSYDQKVLSQLVEKAVSGNGNVGVAMLNGKQVACAVTIADAYQAYYFFGGVDRNAPVQGALGFALAELMNIYRQKGVSIFDFEGSMIPAVENFFRGFGGKQVPYFMVTKAPFVLSTLLRMKGKTEF